jgi:post-segregation antitoxin (ccd killing protein)
MSIKRITISVPNALAGRIKKAAAGVPVSAWVTDALEERLNEDELERQWQAFYRDVNPSRRDVALAEGMFKRLTKRGTRHGAA